MDWSSELYSKRIRRMDPSFFLLHVLFAFRAEMGHNPRASDRSFGFRNFMANFVIFKGMMTSRNCNSWGTQHWPSWRCPPPRYQMKCSVSSLDSDYQDQPFLRSSLCRTCPCGCDCRWYSGSGGAHAMYTSLEVCPKTLAQVIKAISNKDAPHNNYFFYNPLESCGVVETIGYWNACV